MVHNNGPQPFYHWIVQTFMHMGPWNIIFFLVYERLKTLLLPY